MLNWKVTAVSGQPRDAGMFDHDQIIRRNGAVVPFQPNKIAQARMRAFMALHRDAAFLQLIGGGWFNGLWRSIQSSKVCACRVADVLDRSPCMALQQGRAQQQRFFSGTKPDMRNAP